jgi:hypothetical protein
MMRVWRALLEFDLELSVSNGAVVSDYFAAILKLIDSMIFYTLRTLQSGLTMTWASSLCWFP